MARFNTALTSASISGTATIGSPGAGAFTEFTGTAPYTVTVPNPQLYPGVNQQFYNATSGVVTLSTPSGNFNGTGGTGTGTVSVYAGNVVSITSDGTNYIVISEDGSALVATTGAFSGNVTMNGSGATVSITPSTLTVAPTGASTIDSVAIGSTTRAAGAFTSLAANAAVTFTANTTSSSTGTGTLVVTGGIGASGQVTASAVSATNLTGTIQTAAQPNITSTGSLTAPGLAVDTNTIYVDATNHRLGVGTSTPAAKLDINQLSAATGLQVYVNDVTTANIITLKGYDNSLGVMTRMVVQANGLVGIGTASPSETVHISTPNDTVIRLTSVYAGAKSYNITNGGNGNYSPGVFAIRDVTAGTTPFSIYTGNVGINTTNPQGKLTVSNLGAEGIEFFPAASSGVNSTQHYNRSGSAYVRNRTIALDYTFNLSGAGTDAMILNSSGNLGIATATPAYKLHVAGTSGTDDPRLTAINSTIASTALSVFVYDTTKDSDRGAWRKRTQHTSWYNETLNTATRGSRKEFPAVAVMVITATTLTIYDGDDPLMPMWMVFTTSASGWNSALFPLNGVPSSMSAVTALNGIMSVATTNNTIGLATVRFVSDNAYVYCTTNYGGIDNTPLSQRNTSGHTFGSGTTSNLPAIVSITCSDCAMTVLSGAVIDSSTGLPTPTIAVGTAGGVTIINPKLAIGYINLLTSQGTQSKVAFTPSGGFISSGGGGYAYYFYGWYSVPVYATNTSDYTITDGSWSSTAIHRQGFNGNSVLYPIAATNYGHANSETSGVSTTNKLMLVALPTASGYNITTSPGYSLVSYITTKYNTGWMVGNIQGAWLSDSTVETITGSELVSNGTFTSNVTGWTNAGTSITWSSSNGGCAIVTPSASAWTGVYQAITTVVGKRYIATATFITGSGYYSLSMNETGPTYAGKVSYSPTLNPSNSLMKVEWTATTTTAYLTIDNLNTTNTNPLTVDNVSCRIADVDRSPNNFGLAVYGSLTKSLVNTNSDLVAYSGWSTSNYLSQPYSSTMDPTTGEYSVSLWIYTATIANANLVNRSNLDTDESMRVYLNSAGQIYFDYGGASEYAQSIVPAVQASQWTHVLCTAKAGRLGRIYINGQETTYSYQVKAPTPFLSGAYPITVGNHIAYATPFNGSITMVRYSLTAPSNAQVLKMYNDEKELFQTGAKACLYGTSDVVTALAYDDTTKLVHVGTSSGRSILQNLRRIDNTATAVSAAISVSNSLVAEQ
jgi:hypothetical protein